MKIFAVVIIILVITGFFRQHGGGLLELVEINSTIITRLYESSFIVSSADGD